MPFRLDSGDPKDGLPLPPGPPCVMAGVTLHLWPKGPGAIQAVLNHVMMIGTRLAESVPSSVIFLRDEHPVLARSRLVGHGPSCPWKWFLAASAADVPRHPLTLRATTLLRR